MVGPLGNNSFSAASLNGIQQQQHFLASSLLTQADGQKVSAGTMPRYVSLQPSILWGELHNLDSFCSFVNRAAMVLILDGNSEIDSKELSPLFDLFKAFE